MTDIRLDPDTLRWCIEAIRETFADPMLADANGSLEAGQHARHEVLDDYHGDLRRLTNRMVDLADQNEASPPMLSDWVRACEASKLGVPTDCRPTLADFKFGWRAHKLWMLIVAGRAGLTRGQPIGGAAIADYDSPAELTAALDALAVRS